MLPKKFKFIPENFDVEEKVLFNSVRETKIVQRLDKNVKERGWARIIHIMAKSSNVNIIYAGIEEFNIPPEQKFPTSKINFSSGTYSLGYDYDFNNISNNLNMVVLQKQEWFRNLLFKMCDNRNLSLTILTGGFIYPDEPDYYPGLEYDEKYYFTKLKSLLESERIKIVSIPYIWFYISIPLHFSGMSIDTTQLVKTPKTKLFITMIRRNKPFRNFGIDMLGKHNLINEKGVLKVTNITSKLNPTLDQSIFNYPFKYWKPEIIRFQEDAGENAYDMKNFPNQEYLSSFIELVFETQTEFVDISEKSIRPMLFMKPFLLIGDPNLNLRIKEYGFEIFEELFDYSFDKIENLEERIEGAILQLKRYEDLGPEDYDALYKKLLPKLKHNFKRLLTFDKYYPLPEEVLKVPEYVRYLHKRKAFLKRHEHLLEMDIDR